MLNLNFFFSLLHSLPSSLVFLSLSFCRLLQIILLLLLCRRYPLFFALLLPVTSTSRLRPGKKEGERERKGEECKVPKERERAKNKICIKRCNARHTHTQKHLSCLSSLLLVLLLVPLELGPIVSLADPHTIIRRRLSFLSILSILTGCSSLFARVIAAAVTAAAKKYMYTNKAKEKPLE